LANDQWQLTDDKLAGLAEGCQVSGDPTDLTDCDNDSDNDTDFDIDPDCSLPEH